MRDHLLGFPSIAALIAEEHQGRKPQRTAVRPRCTEEEAARRALDVPPKELPKAKINDWIEWKIKYSSFPCPPVTGPCEVRLRTGTILKKDAGAFWWGFIGAHSDGEIVAYRKVTDGWIEWTGGECPVSSETIVVCRLRSGTELTTALPRSMRWAHGGNGGDIVEYRVRG
jgi:hypothetical protein